MPGSAALTIPSTADLQAALERSATIEQLADFDKMMSVLEEAGRRFKLLVDETIRIATFQLSGKRKLGIALLQHHAHGGDRASSRSANLRGEGPLAAIDKDRRRRYKALARIPEEAFANYLQEKAARNEIPKEAGALRCVVSPKQPDRKRKVRAKPSEEASSVLPPDLLDACSRCLGQIDVLVGKAKVKSAVQLDPKDDLTKKARGTVFVAGAPDPEEVLRTVAKLRRTGAIDEAMVVLPRDIDQAWFAALGAGPWSCCVPREVGTPIVAHIGGHARGFSLVFAQLGVVMTVEQAITGDGRE